MMDASDLDRRITIERSTEDTDEFGNPVYEWQALATVAAKRTDISDAERVAYGGIVSTLISRFVIRDVGDAGTVSPVDRLTHDGRTWNISGVKQTQDGRHRFLEITAAVEL